MPLVVVNDPQLASYIGIPVGGLAIDQREEGGGIIGFHGAASGQNPIPYTEALLTAIINGLPELSTLRSKLDVLIALMHSHGAVGRWAGNPSDHPRFGFLWDAYLEDEAQGDALAEAWPEEFIGGVPFGDFLSYGTGDWISYGAGDWIGYG